MALIKSRPTSPGRRFQVRISRDHLHKGGPEESLVVHKNSTGARNHSGRQTVRHQGNGHKQKYRLVDFLRDKDGIPGKVERIEYDPNRTAHLALVLYKDGERRYIIAAKGLTAGDTVISGAEAPIKVQAVERRLSPPRNVDRPLYSYYEICHKISTYAVRAPQSIENRLRHGRHCVCRSKGLCPRVLQPGQFQQALDVLARDYAKASWARDDLYGYAAALAPHLERDGVELVALALPAAAAELYRNHVEKSGVCCLVY